jgi:uncharacterized membrane protein YphA (DoxX/SURF4 family)
MRKVANWTKKEITRDVISAVVLLLFLYTSISKLTEHGRFKAVLATSPLLKKYAGFLAFGIPVAELLLAILLFLPATRLKGLYGSLGLMLVFTIYLAWMVRFAAHLPCNCGGVISNMNWNQHIVFNLAILGLIVFGIICYRTKKEKFYHSPP